MARTQEHDESRRKWLRDERGWIIEVARRQHIHGPAQDIHSTLAVRVTVDRGSLRYLAARRR